MNYDQAQTDKSFAIKLSIVSVVTSAVWLFVFANEWVVYTPAAVLLLPFYAGVFISLIGVPSSLVGLTLWHPQTRWWWLLSLVCSVIGFLVQLRAIVIYLLPGA